MVSNEDSHTNQNNLRLGDLEYFYSYFKHAFKPVHSNWWSLISTDDAVWYWSDNWSTHKINVITPICLEISENASRDHLLKSKCAFNVDVKKFWANYSGFFVLTTRSLEKNLGVSIWNFQTLVNAEHSMLWYCQIRFIQPRFCITEVFGTPVMNV